MMTDECLWQRHWWWLSPVGAALLSSPLCIWSRFQRAHFWEHTQICQKPEMMVVMSLHDDWWCWWWWQWDLPHRLRRLLRQVTLVLQPSLVVHLPIVRVTKIIIKSPSLYLFSRKTYCQSLPSLCLPLDLLQCTWIWISIWIQGQFTLVRCRGWWTWLAHLDAAEPILSEHPKVQPSLQQHHLQVQMMTMSPHRSDNFDNGPIF